MSAVVATRDRPQYLTRLLASLVRQTYAPLEIVVVDDGSSSDLREVINMHCVREFVRVKYHNAARSFNEGFLRSQGEFIIFCDDDCEFSPNMIAKLHDALVSNPSKAYAYCGMSWTNDDNSLKIIGMNPFNAEQLYISNYISSNSLIRRSKFIEAGMFDVSLPRQIDWDVWLTMLEKGEEGVPVPEVLFAHTRNPGPRISSDDHPWPEVPPYQSIRDVIALKHDKARIALLLERLARVEAEKDALKNELEHLEKSFGFRVIKLCRSIVDHAFSEEHKHEHNTN